MKRGLALLLLCASAGWAQQEPERYRHAYDVQFLTRPIRDYRGPTIVDEMGASEVGGIWTESEERVAATGDFLASAIVTNIDEDSWSDDRNSISYENGVLYVTQSKENQKLVAVYLEMLRRRFARRIIVQGEILALSPAAFAAIGASAGVLTEAQEKGFRDAASDPARGMTVATLRTFGMNGQRVYTASLDSQTYIRDYDIEIAQDAVIADPVTGTVSSGDVLDVRPILTSDSTAVLMETRIQHARVLAINSFDTAESALGQLQLPVRELLQSKSSLLMPLGRTALFCAASGPGTERGWVLAVLVKPTLASEAADDATQSTEKRVMKMFDVATLCASVPDFPGPRLRALSENDGVGAPTTAFVPPADEGMGLEPEALIEAIRDSVAIDSWRNQRNKLFLMENAIVAVQTPEVLEQIGKYLSEAMPQRARQISVETVIVAMDDAGWRTRRAALSGPAPDPAVLAALIESANKGEGARLLGQSQGLGVHGQRFHCWAGGDQSYVEDYDVEIAQKASAGDPVIGKLAGGCMMDVRPSLSGDGKNLLLEFQPTLEDAQSAGVINPKNANTGNLGRSSQNTVQMASRVSARDGAWTLAGLTTQTAGGKRVFVATLVRAHMMEVK